MTQHELSCLRAVCLALEKYSVRAQPFVNELQDEFGIIVVGHGRLPNETYTTKPTLFRSTKLMYQLVIMAATNARGVRA